MKVPDQLTVRVSAPHEADLSGFIVELTVTAGRKNPYRIYFPKTDPSGVATLARNDFTGQFTDHWEGGLMDHDGTLKSAEPLVKVGLYDASWSIANREASLAWPLLSHERTKWRSRAEQYHYRTTSRNNEFDASPIVVDLEKTMEFALPVRRRVSRGQTK